MRLIFFLIFRSVRLILLTRYFPRLLDSLLREKVPQHWIRRPLVWWFVRRFLM
jgi:hypothetical protein